jgi:hypothetical protein
MREIGKKTIQLSVTKRETEKNKLPATTWHNRTCPYPSQKWRGSATRSKWSRHNWC